MPAKSLALGAVFLLLATAACRSGSDADSADQEGDQTAAGDLETEDQKTLYALGLMISQNLGPFHLSDDELGDVIAGLRDGASGAEPKVEMAAYAQKVQELARGRAAAAVEGEKEAAQAYLEQVAAEEGAERTESGLIFTEITAGSGDSPAATDTVKVHYHGTLRDGTVFDSSVERGQPAEFPLNRVIGCWTEGLQKLKVGGKARLVCPSDIAYGDQGRPPKIPGGATLIFEVELLEIAAAGSGS